MVLRPLALQGKGGEICCTLSDNMVAMCFGHEIPISLCTLSGNMVGNVKVYIDRTCIAEVLEARFY